MERVRVEGGDCTMQFICSNMLNLKLNDDDDDVLRVSKAKILPSFILVANKFDLI